MLEDEQRDYVRELGRRVHALAASDACEARRRRWRDVNALRRPDRSPVWCKPIGCWRELLPADELKCPNKPYRDVEELFRHYLIKDDIGDDSLIEPYFAVPAAVELDGEHTWGVEIKRHSTGQAGGAWTYDPPVKAEADLDRLTQPTYHHDQAASDRRMEIYGGLFDGVMPVKLTAAPPLMPCPGNVAADLLGLDNMMLSLAVAPEMMHRLMTFLCEGIAGSLDQVEAMGILTENNTVEMYCSDRLKTTAPDEPAMIADLWGQANSQEFELVSPQMWKEFLLDYQKPLLERFGLCSYGCCETLTQKIEGVLTIQNLRIFVSSAWTDLAKVVEAVGGRYAIMWRQKATDVVYPDDTEPIRKHLHEGMKMSQGCCRQIVCRELQTLAGHPRRLHEWAALAKAAAEKYN